MEDDGAFEVTGAAIDRLEKLVVDDDHASKDATKIAEATGIRVPAGTPCCSPRSTRRTRSFGPSC